MLRRSLIFIVAALVLLTAGFGLRNNYTNQFPTALHKLVEENVATAYEVINQEAAALLLDSLAPSSPTWDHVLHYFIHADSTGIMTWNRNLYSPDAFAWTGDGDIAFVPNQRGDFLLKKWPFKGGFLVNVLSLRDQYPITNNFLSTELNKSIFPIKELDLVAPSGPAGDPIQLEGKTVFRVVSGAIEPRDSFWSFSSFILGLALLFAGLHAACLYLEVKFAPDFAFVALLLTMYGVRWGMVFAGIPALFVRTDIFDPRVFASSPLNASMGDLFFNGACVFIIVLYFFRHFRKMKLIRWLLHQHQTFRFVIGTLCLLLALFAVLFSFNFIEVVYHNSALTLDVTQSLTLERVRIVAFLSILIGTTSAFLFIHVLVAMARHLLPGGFLPFALSLLIASGSFFLQANLSGNDNSISLIMGLLLFAMIRWLNFDKLEFKFSFLFFIYLIGSLSFFSIHHALTIRLFHAERQVREQFRYGKDFLTERDVLGEYLLNRACERIKEDQFIQARMASPFFTKTSVIDKVKRLHLNSYFDRYELEVTTRNRSDSADGVHRTETFLPTGYPGISYSSTTMGEAVRHYHVSVPIHYQRPVGSVELDLVLKRVVPDNVFPELLVDNRFSQIYRNRDFSYAIFKEGHLLNSFGVFNYERDFQKSRLTDPVLFQGGITGKNYFHVGIEEADGSVAVVSAAVYPVSSVVTNASFWFVLGLAILLLVQGAFGVHAWVVNKQFAYTARIQWFMFLAFAVPMAAVSVTTLTLMGRSRESATTEEYLDRSVSTSQRIAALFSSDTSRDRSSLESWIVENASHSKTDVSVYSPEGMLLTTSQPALFENQLLSTRINPEAFKRITLDGERQTVTNEQIGTLKYSCAYAAVLSPQSGRLEAIVSLPFFESATYLQKSHILILSNILQVFVVVFLVFSFFSFLAAGNLSFPIRFIAKKLRQTTFTGENKPLEWKTSDEIGVLVSEYNRMVQNLEESKRALAQSEKESAWREMAKQVAHEIKNPLTPMKLTLQQMEKGISSGDYTPEKSRKSVDVLLKQVEILNAIAASFSTFARMPAPAPQQMDLGVLVSETAGLFTTGDNGLVINTVPANTYWVSVDPTSFSRALSNMIINAVQAKADGRDAIVTISATSKEKMVTLEIRDNGRGIPTELQEKVFQPQFTTKQSGSGLGLAMARQIVLQAGGRIWFNSVPDHGSTFYIELPLALQGSPLD